MEMKFVKASELLEKEDFLRELSTKENDEEVVDLFKKYGVELSVDDVEKMCEESIAYAKQSEGELDEEAMDSVSGGVILSTTACFVLAVANISFYINYGKRKYGKKK